MATGREVQAGRQGPDVTLWMEGLSEASPAGGGVWVRSSRTSLGLGAGLLCTEWLRGCASVGDKPGTDLGEVSVGYLGNKRKRLVKGRKSEF